MKLVNATIVKEPGKTGSSWRIHYSLKLPDLNCDYFKLTGIKGQGTGESFKQFPVEKNDCIIGDRGYSIEKALKKLKREASKKQSDLKPETIEYAKYIIVFTTLPTNDFSTKEVLDWYRLCWQIELVFKRLKSLAGLGHLPKFDEGSARAWLQGKLFIGLMIEKLIRYSSDFSP